MSRKSNAMQAIDAHVGSKIRFYRMQRGLSQADLAEKLCVSYQQLHKYEKGSNGASASRLAEISMALNIPVAKLFEGFDTDEFVYSHHAETHRQHIQFIKYYNRISCARHRDAIQLMIRVFSSEPLRGK